MHLIAILFSFQLMKFIEIGSPKFTGNIFWQLKINVILWEFQKSRLIFDTGVYHFRDGITAVIKFQCL